eukprot:TRINITY_DN32168_c0_g1_i1.p2 TRINITY_DN32168_c0_g1~~TRINITY_DN32168_c0_g1_i1.p2  ORF type:complete len:276 (+),score=49.31 TRINITY_DN32168_c0_g1_i1:111-830(+)
MATATKSCAADLVTVYDKQCEDLILRHLCAPFPKFRCLAEETAADNGLGDEPTWIVDPIDGTTNFVHTHYHCCVSIGLAVGRELVVGVVHNPNTRETFEAVRGGGAFCNGEPIHVSAKAGLPEALVGCNFPARRTEEKLGAIFNVQRSLLVAGVHGLRVDGSSAIDLCNVAMGRLDAFFEVGIQPWDVAAGAVILREAGGVMTDTTGDTFDPLNHRVIGANSPALAAEIARICLEHKYH